MWVLPAFGEVLTFGLTYDEANSDFKPFWSSPGYVEMPFFGLFLEAPASSCVLFAQEFSPGSLSAGLTLHCSDRFVTYTFWTSLIIVATSVPMRVPSVQFAAVTSLHPSSLGELVLAFVGNITVKRTIIDEIHHFPQTAVSVMGISEEH